MTNKPGDLELRIASMPSTALLRMIEKESYQYTAEALAAAEAEVKKRGGIEILKWRAEEELKPKQNPSQAYSIFSFQSGVNAIMALRVFAWLDLLFGFIAAVIILDHFEKSVITFASALGVAFQGAFACSFFLVVASIAENLIAIRKQGER